MGNRIIGFAAAAGLAFMASTVGANAVVINATVGGLPTGSSYVNFDNLPLDNSGGSSGGIGVAFTPDARS